MKTMNRIWLSVAVLLGTATGVFAADLWFEQFFGTADTKPAGWYDQADGVGPAAQIFLSTNSYANVTVTNTSGWGNVNSWSQPVDLTTYTKLEVVVSSLNNGATLVVGLFHPAPWQYFRCNPVSISSPGKYTFDIPTVTGESGTVTYGVQLTVEGNQGAYAIVDSIRIHTYETPTPTCTFSATYTSTATMTPTPTSTISATPSISTTATPTPNQSLTLTNTPTQTLTATISATRTGTPTLTGTRTQTQTYTATPTATPSPTANPGTDVIYDEPFDTEGAPPIGWTDNSIDPSFHVNLSASSGYGYLTITGATYGKIQNTSDINNVDTDQYPYLSFAVTSISPSADMKVSLLPTIGTQTDLTATVGNLSGIITAPGLYTFDYKQLMGWAGSHSFKIIVWVEGASGKTVVLDRIHVHHVLPATPTPTATRTSTLTGTPTPTITVTLTPVPLSEAFMDHFTNGIAPNIPAGWRDNTTNPDQIVNQTLVPGFHGLIQREGSTFAVVSNTVTGFGKVLSKVISADMTAYQELEVAVATVQPNTRLFLGIQMEESGNYAEYDLGGVITSPGVYTRNLPALNTTAFSGLHTFAIKLRIDSSGTGAANSVTLDYIRLGITSTPTASPTMTPTAVVNNFRPAVNLFLPKDGPLKLYYGVEKPTKHKITVFNLAGQVVRTLEEKDDTATIYGSIDWDGKNDSGDWVASGVYIIRLETDVYRQNIRVAVVR